MSNSGLQGQIMEGLRSMQAHDLQVMAEEIAAVKFPERFRIGTMIRSGRNADSQTTKNWPDAYVPGPDGKVDGVEATRDKTNWQKHLSEDLEKARDPERLKLSGYVFVGGYPNEGPGGSEINDWIKKFAALGVPEARITILVGLTLVAELVDHRYAQIRQKWFGIPTEPEGFKEISSAAPAASGLDLLQATAEDFNSGHVGAPALLDRVLDELDQSKACLVRGLGAAGKTTLAQLVAYSDRVAPSPAWIVDLTNPGFDESAALGGLTLWSGEGVLFVIDNIHLNEAAAIRIIDHWRKYLQSQGTRLLLLGRKTRLNKSGDLASLRSLELRAGTAEMSAVVSRLFRREGHVPPVLTRETLDDWAQIFGGSRDPAKVAVDLIAFTAAVIGRIATFRKGDFRLTAEDAIDGVRKRYLAPLANTPERSDLLRLASLACFEIPIYAELLTHHSGLDFSINKLGIVLVEQTGQEERKAFRFVHHALGNLLLKAAPDFDVESELQLVAGLNPSVGVRMVLNAREVGGEPGIERAIHRSLDTGIWLGGVRDSYDLAAIIRYTLRQGRISAYELDLKILADGWLCDLIGGIRSLRGINALNQQLAKSGLSLSLAAIGQWAACPSSNVHATMLVASPSEVATLIRAHPEGNAILVSIATTRWNTIQANVPPETAGNAASAGLYFERQGRSDLAIGPCLRLIRANDVALWARCDISHLSHVLRLAGHPDPETGLLIESLFEGGWLDRAYSSGSLGPLCGGLMSLANYLNPAQHAQLLTKPLAARVIEELAPEFWIDDVFEKSDAQPFSKLKLPRTPSRYDHGSRRWLADKHISRPICLLGSFACLGGRVDTPKIDWDPPLVARMFNGLRGKSDATFLGMYALQFWAGLKVLARQGHGPARVPSEEGERFMAALDKSEPPTPAAADIKAELLAWLRECQGRSWALTS